MAAWAAGPATFVVWPGQSLATSIPVSTAQRSTAQFSAPPPPPSFSPRHSATPTASSHRPLLNLSLPFQEGSPLSINHHPAQIVHVPTPAPDCAHLCRPLLPANREPEFSTGYLTLHATKADPGQYQTWCTLHEPSRAHKQRDPGRRRRRERRIRALDRPGLASPRHTLLPYTRTRHGLDQLLGPDARRTAFQLAHLINRRRTATISEARGHTIGYTEYTIPPSPLSRSPKRRLESSQRQPWGGTAFRYTPYISSSTRSAVVGTATKNRLVLQAMCCPAPPSRNYSIHLQGAESPQQYLSSVVPVKAD